MLFTGHVSAQFDISKQLVEVRDSAFVQAYNNLKTKYLEYVETDSYKKMRALHKDFFRKLNHKGDPRLLEQTPIQWVKENLNQTSFFSLHEAETEWEQYILAQQDDFKVNEEIFLLISESIDKYGYYIYTDLMKELSEKYRHKLSP